MQEIYIKALIIHKNRRKPNRIRVYLGRSEKSCIIVKKTREIYSCPCLLPKRLWLCGITEINSRKL
jgi:hypothetical protein